MKPEWQTILDEIAKRDPVLPDETYGIMDVVAYAAELHARIRELEATEARLLEALGRWKNEPSHHDCGACSVLIDALDGPEEKP